MLLLPTPAFLSSYSPLTRTLFSPYSLDLLSCYSDLAHTLLSCYSRLPLTLPHLTPILFAVVSSYCAILLPYILCFIRRISG